MLGHRMVQGGINTSGWYGVEGGSFEAVQSGLQFTCLLCRHIDRFTAFSGELFGMLIAMLFNQQTVEGLKAEFRVATGPGAVL